MWWSLFLGEPQIQLQTLRKLQTTPTFSISMNFIRNLFSLVLLIVGFKASKNLDIVSLVFVKKIRRKYKEKDIMKTTTTPSLFYVTLCNKTVQLKIHRVQLLSATRRRNFVLKLLNSIVINYKSK